MTLQARLVEVALPLPLNQTFTYIVPDSLPDVECGFRVLVPFRNRTLTGFVMSHSRGPAKDKTKSIYDVLDSRPILTSELLRLVSKMTKIYGASLGDALQTVLPPGMTRVSKKKVRAKRKDVEPMDPVDRKWFLRVRESKGLDWMRLQKSAKEDLRILHRLIEDGWLEILEELPSDRSFEKTLRVLSLHPNKPKSAPKGPLQKKIIEFLQTQNKAIPLKDLSFLGKVDTSVRGLIKSKYLISSEVPASDLQTEDPLQAPSFMLNDEQDAALKSILAALTKERFSEFLLHGVTGSGKTELYLRATAHCLSLGRAVIALVPEIALTPQFVGRFRARFGDKIAVLHSGRTPKERTTDWRRILRGDVRVAIGARSAIFAPLSNLGLIIMDEEHDASYKQEEGLHYHARELAWIRARERKAVLVLGSATPSLETFHRVQTEEIELLHLPSRASGQSMPEVRVIDLRTSKSKFGEKGVITEDLRSAIETRLEKGEQTVLFLNRRGFAPIAFRPKAGESIRCEHCSVSLTFHQKEREYRCHYCGVTISEMVLRDRYPGEAILHLGIGTERVQDELHDYFPDANIVRMDRDSVKGRVGFEDMIRKMEDREIDILIGTQMVTKGMDMPFVTLVGVLLADHALHFPDFRASETTFQLLTQVIGRAGRADLKGEAIIQTYQPDHYVIQCAAKQDFQGFYEKEIVFRQKLLYPPFSSLALLELTSRHRDSLQEIAKWMRNQIFQMSKKSKRPLWVLGPSWAPIAKVKEEHRMHILVKGESRRDVTHITSWAVQAAQETIRTRKVRLRLDIDPYQFL